MPDKIKEYLKERAMKETTTTSKKTVVAMLATLIQNDADVLEPAEREQYQYAMADFIFDNFENPAEVIDDVYRNYNI